jgi:hypothetical protein
MTTVTVANVEQPDDGPAVTNQVSASAAPKALSPWLAARYMVLVAAVAVIMWLLYHFLIKPKTFTFATGYVPYAGIVAVTAALERLLEPLSHVLGPATGPAKQDAATSKSAAQAAGADPGKSTAAVQEAAKKAATDQANVDAKRTQRTIIFWAIASVCGLAISGGFGLFLLQSVTKGHVNTFLDLTVTGLTIGAGTKPLHDLITGIQAKAASSS